ncbi:MAG: hypothetical protein IH624_04010 [Phycisphaerae bacterium]|nr:hypothetical protein [Phycisphaerae bacterium]
MSSNLKNVVIVSIILVMPAIVLAAGKQTVWVVEDFESYQSTTDMLATGLDTGGPWWNAYSLTQVLPGGSGDPTPPFPTTMTLGLGEPNGFTSEGETLADPNSPKSMIIHYEIPNESRSADFLILAHNLGLPFNVVQTPIGNLAIVDLTQFDKAQFKIKKFSGNQSHPNSAFTMAFVAPDTTTIGYYRARRTQLPSGIMAASQDVWEILEFDLSAELLGREDSASIKDVGVDVVAVVFGIEDEPSSSVTFAVDDIALYTESECPRYLPADLNGDCIVSLADLAVIAGQWLQ